MSLSYLNHASFPPPRWNATRPNHCRNMCLVNARTPLLLPIEAVGETAPEPPKPSGIGIREKLPPTKTPNARKAEDTRSFTEASAVAFVPRDIKVNFVLLLAAKKALEVGSWLDNCLYHSLRQRDMIIGSYIGVAKEPGTDTDRIVSTLLRGSVKVTTVFAPKWPRDRSKWPGDQVKRRRAQCQSNRSQ